MFRGISLNTLVDEGMLSYDDTMRLVNYLKEGVSIILTGKSGSGRSTLELSLFLRGQVWNPDLISMDLIYMDSQVEEIKNHLNANRTIIAHTHDMVKWLNKDYLGKTTVRVHLEYDTSGRRYLSKIEEV